MNNRLRFLLPHPDVDQHVDLMLPWLAQLAADAQEAARGRSASALAALPREAQRELLAHTRAARATVWGALDDSQQGYLAAKSAARALAEQRARHQIWLAHLHDHMSFVGGDGVPATWSHLGWSDDRADQPLALARDRGNVILCSGIPGSGKTLLSTLIGEGSFLATGTKAALAAATLLPTVYAFFHLEENDRLPQLLDGLKPNPTPRDLALLMERLGVGGRGLGKLRLALPHWLKTPELLRRLRPYQDLGLDVVEIRVHLGEIGQPGLEAALGADDGTRLAQRLLDDAQDQGQALCIAGMRKFIDEATDLDVLSKDKARKRVDILEKIEAAADQPGIWGLFEPGWATVVYLGGPHMGHKRVGPVLVSLISGLMMHSDRHGEFQRIIAVDEFNLLDKDEAVWRMFVKAGRLARHRGWTMILMGQDLFCVPDEMFGVAGLVAVFRQSSPQAFEHQQKRVGALRSFRFADVAELAVGEALLAVLQSSSGQRAFRVRFRPPLCMHGGFTRGVV